MSADNKLDIQEVSSQPASPARSRVSWQGSVGNIVRGLSGGALLLTTAACASPDLGAQPAKSSAPSAPAPAGNGIDNPNSIQIVISAPSAPATEIRLDTQNDYISHLFALSHSYVRHTIPGLTKTSDVIFQLDLAGQPVVMGDGSGRVLYKLNEGVGTEIGTYSDMVIMQEFESLEGQEPSLDAIIRDYGKPNYMEKGVFDPSFGPPGPYGAWAYWNDKFGGGFAALFIDLRNNTAKKFAVVNDAQNNPKYDYKHFKDGWGRHFGISR